MGLEKMMADACALRMRQLADWQADAAKRSDDIRALLDVLDGLPCRVSLGGLAYVSVSVWVCDDADGLRVCGGVAIVAAATVSSVWLRVCRFIYFAEMRDG